MKQKYKNIIIIVLLTLISSIPIFLKNEALAQGHDTMFHLNRILGVSDNLKILKPNPVYYNYLNHFGYGNGIFYPDIFLYIPALLFNFGISIIDSYKIFIIIINLFSILSIKVCLDKTIKDEKSTKIGMILYAFSMYRFTDMYIRGAIGESIGFIFLPLVVLGLYKIFFENHKEGYYLLIGLVGLMLSHVITTYITIFIIVIFTIMNYKYLDRTRTKELIINILLSMAITSFFWLPMIEQLLSNEFNIKNNVKIFENCIPIQYLMTDIEAIKNDSWYPPGIGAIYYILIPMFIKTKNKNRFINVIFTFGIISICMASLKILWKIPLLYKLLSVIQMPWRMYNIATICFIIVTCFILKENEKNKMTTIFITYASFLFLINCILLSKNPIIRNDFHGDSIMTGEYLPIELKDNYLHFFEEYKNNDIKYEHEHEKLKIEIINNKEEIELPLIYYKGYVAQPNNNIEIKKSDQGLVMIKAPKDTKELTIFYKGTRIKKFSKIITLIGLLLIILNDINHTKNNEKKNKK